LHQCIRPLIGAHAPGHHGYQRACDLISDKASTGPFGSPVFACAGRPNLHLVSSSRRPRQVSRIDQATSSRAPHLSMLISRWTISSLGGCVSIRPCLEVPAAGQNAPSDAGELVGERNRQHVGCSRFLAASIQGLSPWRSQLLGLISTTQAACTNRTRR